jgi:transposase
MASRCSPKRISTMPINFRISALVPVGLIVESVAQLDDSILVTTRFGIQMASCPLCGSPSRRVHSRSVREVSDLPCSGRSVRLRVVIRRYRRDTQHCRRRIFVERFNKAELDLKNRFAEYIAANGWKVESGAKFSRRPTTRPLLQSLSVSQVLTSGPQA